MTKSTKKLQAIEYVSKAMVLVATAPNKDDYAEALQDLMFISRELTINEIKEIGSGVRKYMIKILSSQSLMFLVVEA